MTDTVIKGAGNSRSIRSVPNFAALFPTWESYRDAMATEGVPIDLGPLNPAGLELKGDDLNTANLLKDATAALYGLTNTAVPDDVLAKVRELIAGTETTVNSKAKVEYGSYRGAGTTSKTLTFSFPPRLVALAKANGYESPMIITCVYGVSFTHGFYSGSNDGNFALSWSGTSLTISKPPYGTSGSADNINTTYYYIAIG